jgi:hypothetical protein
MLPNCCHKAVQDAGEYYPAAALHKYHVLLQPHKDQQYRQYRDLSIKNYINRFVFQNIFIKVYIC